MTKLFISICSLAKAWAYAEILEEGMKMCRRHINERENLGGNDQDE